MHWKSLKLAPLKPCWVLDQRPFDEKGPDKGRSRGPFWMNFRKTSKRPLTPPPPRPRFGKLCCAFFGRPENLQRNSFGLAWPPPFSRKFIVFTPPKLPKKPQRNFLDRKWPSPPLRKFSENSSKMAHTVVPNWKNSSILKTGGFPLRPCDDGLSSVSRNVFSKMFFNAVSFAGEQGLWGARHRLK